MDSTAKTSRSSQYESVTAASRHPISGFGYFAAILFLIFCTQPATRVVKATTSDTQTDAVGLAFQALAYVMILCAMSGDWKALIRKTISRRMMWILALNGIAVISVIWSDLPGLTFRRSLLLFVNVLIAVSFTTTFPFDRRLKILSSLFIGTLLCSLLAVVLFPEYGVMGSGYDASLQGAWRGIWEHKNILGRYSALGILIFFFRYLQTRNIRWLACIAFAVVLLLGSKSKTALLVLVAVFATIPLFRIGVKRPKTIITLVAISGIYFSLYISQHLYQLFDWLGRDMSLTGRIPLWVMGIILGVRRNPWLGYGFNDFWRGQEGDSLLLWKAVHWPAPNIHNGFIELWLALGVAGLSVFLVCHSLTFLRALMLQKYRPSLVTLWNLVFLAYFTLENLTESVAVNYNSLMWILYVSVVYEAYESAVVRARSSSSIGQLIAKRGSEDSGTPGKKGRTHVGSVSPELL